MRTVVLFSLIIVPPQSLSSPVITGSVQLCAKLCTGIADNGWLDHVLQNIYVFGFPLLPTCWYYDHVYKEFEMGDLGTNLTCANSPTCSHHPHTHIHTHHIHATYTNSAIFKRQSSKSVRISEKARAKIFPYVRHLVESDRKRILVSSLTLLLLNHCVCSPTWNIGKRAWSHLQNSLYVLSQCIM